MLYRSLNAKMLSCCFLLLCLVACGQFEPSSGTTTQLWTHQWLQSSAICRAPCWEGITPGQTTVAQAYSLLSQNPLTQSTTIFTSPSALDTSEIDWQWRDGAVGGRMFYSVQSSPHIIHVIQVNYPNTFALQDVIAAYGNPSHIIATKHIGGFPGESGPSDVDYSIWVVYLEKGLLLGAGGKHQLDIHADLELSTPTFFAPGQATFTALFNQMESKALVPWQGYREFGFYCRTENTKDVCKAGAS
jgi:hypothetical protein